MSLLQQLAMAIWFGDWKKGHMAFMNCYTDVGGSLSEVVIAPAILVSTPDKWIEFDRRWSETLAAHGITSLHMKDFAHFKGEYAPFRQDELRRRRLLNALMWIIEELIEYTSAVAVYTDDYNRVDLKYMLSERMRPYTMGCLACASHVAVWAKANDHPKNEIAWFFEKGDQDQDDLRKHWDIAYPDAAVEPVFLKKVDEHLGDKPRRIRPFEAADLIGYENLHAHRILGKSANKKIPYFELRKPKQRMSKAMGADRWGYLSETEMLRACPKWGIPAR
jgi:hypothetical protein